MTKNEFLYKAPNIIDHKTWGYGELEIICDSKEIKGVCYKHPDNTASCGTYGSTWLEVYKRLNEHLTTEGYLKS